MVVFVIGDGCCVATVIRATRQGYEYGRLTLPSIRDVLIIGVTPKQWQDSDSWNLLAFQCGVSPMLSPALS